MSTLTLADTTPSTRIVLTREWHKQSMARAVPGAWFCADEGVKAWVLEDPTPRAAAVALKLFPELTITHPELTLLRAELATDVRPFDLATAYAKRIEPQAPAVVERLAAKGFSFFDFQDIDLGYLADVLREHGGAYIGWSRGLGKTLGTAGVIDATGAQRTLIVAPNTAKDSVWRAELAEYLPNAEVHVLPNQKVKRERMLSALVSRSQSSQRSNGPGQPGPTIAEDAARYEIATPQRSPMAGSGDTSAEGRPQVLVIHYEALQILEKGGWWKKLGEWDLVVADEAHRLKNPSALMSRAIKKIKARMRLALSGSIIQNHIEELFSVLQWLFPTRYKAKWRDWNDRYLDYVESSYGRVCVGVKPERLHAMRDELSRFMCVRYKEDELPDLPAKIVQQLYVDLTSNQRRVYNTLVDECLARLDDGTVIKAAEGLTLLTRLRQVATGLDLFGGDMTDSSKLDMAVELIEDNPDEAFVVFSWFKAAARALAKRLTEHRIGCFVVDGDVPHEVRSEQIARFQSGEGRVFIGTISTLAESVTLHRASQCLMLDRSWNPAQNDQAHDRIHRIGQKRLITVTDLVAKDTVDEYRVMPALANKNALRMAVLGGRS